MANIDFTQVRRCLLNMARVCVGCPMIRIQHFGTAPDPQIICTEFLQTGLALTNYDKEKANIYLDKLKGYVDLFGWS